MNIFRQLRLLPESASSVSGRVDTLTMLLTAVSLFMTLLIFALILIFAIRYRRRSENEIPPETRSHNWMEWTWSVGLFAFLMVFFVWGARLYVEIKKPAQHALEVNVVGKQWMWKIQHPGGQREINELHVPLGEPIKLIMISQDVIHSFGLPDFRIKQDVLPGSYSTQWFTATKTGEFHLFCQEYCGTSHSEMIGRVIVMQPAAYQAWLAGTPPEVSPLVSGAKLFARYGCAQCHGQLAPTLAGLYGRPVKLSDGRTVNADENYIRESILNPPARLVGGYSTLMPSFRGQLSEEQINGLIAYIKSLQVAMPATQPLNTTLQRFPNIPPAPQLPGDSSPAPGGLTK